MENMIINENSIKLNKIIYMIILIVLLFLTPERFEAFDPIYIQILTSIYFIALVIFLVSQKKLFKNWLRFDVLFLLGFSIVHYQIPFLESVGIQPERPNFVWINKEVVNYATWMSTMGICLWMLGYKTEPTIISNNNR